MYEHATKHQVYHYKIQTLLPKLNDFYNWKKLELRLSQQPLPVNSEVCFAVVG